MRGLPPAACRGFDGRSIEMNTLPVSSLTPYAFAPFGMIGTPTVDSGHAAGDIPLDLSQGRPRFYIMRLEQRGLAFDRMARHNRVTQCLGTTDGRPWLIAVAPAGIESPNLADIRAFEVPGDRFIMLGARNLARRPSFHRR